VKEQIIACLGSSTVAGKGQAYNLIGELQKKPENEHVRFLNFGVGGDLAYNALERLPRVIAARPDQVIVIIGGNDILASVFPNVWRIFRLTKHVPQQPSLEWFKENVQSIVRELKAKTTARVALVSLPQVGEDPNSNNAAQERLNALYRQYAEVLKEVAQHEQVTYIPFYERLQEQIAMSPGRAFTAFRFLPFYRDTFRYFVLRKSGDEIARLNGWKFHVDGVHLNSRGGAMLADLMQEFITDASVVTVDAI